MRRLLLPLLLLATTLIACGGEKASTTKRSPTSVRGTISEITPAGSTLDAASMRRRKYEFLAQTSLAVEGVEFASGGVSDLGAFVVLDVPPSKAIILFNAPGIPNAQLILENVPGDADVLIPSVALRGSAVIPLHPEKILIRIPGTGPAKKTAATAKVAGFTVPIWEVPITELVDRREYPTAERVITTVPLR